MFDPTTTADAKAVDKDEPEDNANDPDTEDPYNVTPIAIGKTTSEKLNLLVDLGR